MNNNEDNFDRKSSRRKNLQDKNFKKKEYDEDYSLIKKSKQKLKEDLEKEEWQEWEEWDKYYNR